MQNLKQLNIGNIKYFVMVTCNKSKARNAGVQNTLEKDLIAVNLWALGPQPSPWHGTATFHPLLSPRESGMPMAHLSGIPLTTEPHGHGSALLLYITKR